MGGRAEVYVEDLTPRFSFSAAYGQVTIEVEAVVETTTWVALSSSCWALLNGEFVAGVVATL